MPLGAETASCLIGKLQEEQKTAAAWDVFLRLPEFRQLCGDFQELVDLALYFMFHFARDRCLEEAR